VRSCSGFEALVRDLLDGGGNKKKRNGGRKSSGIERSGGRGIADHWDEARKQQTHLELRSRRINLNFSLWSPCLLLVCRRRFRFHQRVHRLHVSEPSAACQRGKRRTEEVPTYILNFDVFPAQRRREEARDPQSDEVKGFLLLAASAENGFCQSKVVVEECFNAADVEARRGQRERTGRGGRTGAPFRGCLDVYEHLGTIHGFRGRGRGERNEGELTEDEADAMLSSRAQGCSERCRRGGTV
jgi:hypothetical protein